MLAPAATQSMSTGRCLEPSVLLHKPCSQMRKIRPSISRRCRLAQHDQGWRCCCRGTPCSTTARRAGAVGTHLVVAGVHADGLPAGQVPQAGGAVGAGGHQVRRVHREHAVPHPLAVPCGAGRRHEAQDVKLRGAAWGCRPACCSKAWMASAEAPRLQHTGMPWCN
jgi:hypothetical protein